MLNKYIKFIIITISAVVLLLGCGTQTVGEHEVNMTETPTLHSKEIILVTHPAPTETTVQEEMTEQEKAQDEEDEYLTYYTEDDITDIAKLLLRECGGVPSKTERACVAWCVLNRVDEQGCSIYDVLRAPNQFAFYESTEVREDLYDLAEDVLHRWNDERNGNTDVGRVLPKEYTYFHGDGVHNYFRNAFDGNYDIWDYSLVSPYEN